MVNVSNFDLIANKFSELTGVDCKDERYILWSDTDDEERKELGQKALSILENLKNLKLINMHKSSWYPHCYRVTVRHQSDFLACSLDESKRIQLYVKSFFNVINSQCFLSECSKAVVEGKVNSQLIEDVAIYLFDSHCGLQDSSEQILEKMINERFCLNKIKDVAHRALLAFNSYTGLQALRLFRLLEQNGLFDDEDLKHCMDALEHRSGTVRTSGSYVLGMLAKKGLHHRKIFAKMELFSRTDQMDKLINMTLIGRALLKGGYDSKALVKFAKIAVENKLQCIQQYGLEFVCELVARSAGTEEAMNYTLEYLEASDDRLREIAVEIIGHLCPNIEFAAAILLLDELRKLKSRGEFNSYLCSAFDYILAYLPSYRGENEAVLALANEWSINLQEDAVKLYCSMILHPEFSNNLIDFQDLAHRWAFDETSSKHRGYGRRMYARLIHKSDSQEVAIQAERFRIKKEDNEDELLNALVRNQLAFDVALDLIRQDLKGENPFTHVSLLYRLMSNGEGLEEGLEMLKYAYKQHDSYGVYKTTHGIRLLEELAKTKKANAAISFVQNFIWDLPSIDKDGRFYWDHIKTLKKLGSSDC